MWKKPASTQVDHETAVKWWLESHFEKTDDLGKATWAIDLYASYLDACVQTRMLPVMRGALFGRIAGDNIAKGGFRVTEENGTRRRGGNSYLVTIIGGHSMIDCGPSGNTGSGAGSRYMASLYADAMAKTGATMSAGWSAFEEKRAADIQLLASWLEKTGRQALKPPDDGVFVKTGGLFAEFRLTHKDWSNQRFNRVLGYIGKVKRGENGSAKVVLLAKV